MRPRREEFYISPNVVKQLRRGEAGLVIKHPGFYVDACPGQKWVGSGGD